MIRLHGVDVQAGSFALRDIALEIEAGSYALIIGPTGSGKTTLLEAIAGHARVQRGTIQLNGVDATALPPELRGIGVVHQRYLLFPHLTVGENIAYGLRALDADAARARVMQLAAALGIAALLDRRPDRLSGGEQQRTALARALAPRPRVLLLDEPFAAVDPSTRRALRHELQQLHAESGTTTLQVTHDFEDALRLGQHVTVLAEGRVVQQGRPETVFQRPNSAWVAHFTGAGTVLAGHVRATTAATAEGRFAARFVSGALELDVLADREGEAHAVIRPEDVLLSTAPILASARNSLRGLVQNVERSSGLLSVTVDVGALLTASITPAGAESLDLRPGAAVWLTLKATAIHLV